MSALIFYFLHKGSFDGEPSQATSAEAITHALFTLPPPIYPRCVPSTKLRACGSLRQLWVRTPETRY